MTKRILDRENSTVKNRSGSPVGILCPAPALTSVKVKATRSPGLGDGGSAFTSTATARLTMSGSWPPRRVLPPTSEGTVRCDRPVDLWHVTALADKSALLHEEFPFILRVGPARTHSGRTAQGRRRHYGSDNRVGRSGNSIKWVGCGAAESRMGRK